MSGKGRWMPTLEFFGMDGDEHLRLEGYLRKELSEDQFREACVFVRHDVEVVDWQGRSSPFIRVSTRSKQRAERFREVLDRVCDVEIVHIEFYPRSGEVCGE
jgi:hypothetical protein